MIIEAKYHLSLSAIVAKAMDLYGIEDEKARAKMQQDVADFIRLRLKNVLESIRYDVVDASLLMSMTSTPSPCAPRPSQTM